MANLKCWETDYKENTFPFCQQPSSSGSSIGSSPLKKSTKIGRRTRIPLQDITHQFVNDSDHPVQTCSAPSPNSTALELKKQCRNGTIFDRGFGLKSSCNARSEALRKGFR